ncbi:MAG TPA: tetrahydrofolate dehydrogenase/cyclohydrolase catalytic domain-containing protein [Thermoanaerobaculia bacterium]|nr:tetrahydrofolate dehydrogenase/cyclohydrolase catalytic domain-containing protein [Thermoanaerobaculia bacterium]
MAGLVLDGRAPAREIEARLAERVRALAAGVPPALAIVLAGTDPAYLRFARMKEDACRRVGIEPLLIARPPGTATAELAAEIDRLNGDPRVHGIFLQHPLAPPLDERRCFDRIAVEKDVGGDGSASFGRLAVGESAFAAATPAAILRLLSCYGIPIAGKAAVVVGRSPMVGRPAALLLLAANATVTVCHSRTRRLPEVVRSGEIVVGAVNRPRFIKGQWLRDGAVVIDAGSHPGGVGDVELAADAHRCAAYTPVPGGVGPMTIAMLLENTVTAAERAEHAQRAAGRAGAAGG